MFATSDSIITLGQIRPWFRLEDLRANKVFNVVEPLSVNIFIETDFKDKYLTGIYPMERCFKPLRSSSIAILLTEASDKLVITTASTQPKEELQDSTYSGESETKSTVKLRIAKQSSIKPNSMQTELVVSTGRVLMYFEQDKQLTRHGQLLFAEGTMEFLPNRPFYTLIGNSTTAEIHIPKHMVIGQSSTTLPTIADPGVSCQHSLVDNQSKSSTSNTDSIYSKKILVEET